MAIERSDYHKDYQKKHRKVFYANKRLNEIITKEAEKHGSESALINSIVTQFYKGYEHN